MKLGRPVWVDYPDNLQFDTHNYCNLSCEYCNVKDSGAYKLPRGKMTMETYTTVLKYFGKKLGLWSVSQFMNGEPMLEDRLPLMVDLAKKITGTSSIIDTNGSVYANRHLLLNPNLRLVRFTISAITPETYEIVHGKDLFREASATYQWFIKNKFPSQNVWFHFILTKHNEHELDRWIQHFNGFGRSIFPVHMSSQQVNSQKSKHSGYEWEPFLITPQNQRVHIRPWKDSELYPCPCWGIMGIGWNGEIMQCVDFPYKYNYGKVGETDLLDAWRERNRNAMDNDCCNDCGCRFPKWKKIFEKYERTRRRQS